MQFVQCRAAGGTTAALLFAVSLGWGFVPVHAGTGEIVDPVLEAERAGAQVIQPLASLQYKAKLEEFKSRLRWFDKHHRRQSKRYGVIAPVRPDPMATCLFKGGLCGALNADGSVAVPPQFDFVDQFRDARARVRFHGRFGFVDTLGHVVIAVEWDEAENFKFGIARVRLNGLYGYVDTSGAIIVPVRFKKTDDLLYGRSQAQVDGLVPLYESKFVSLYERKGRLLFVPKNRMFESDHDDAGRTGAGQASSVGHAPDKSDDFIEWTPFYEQGMYGAARKDGTVVIKPGRYDTIGHLNKGLAIVMKDGKYGVVKADGSEFIVPRFEQAGPFHRGFADVMLDGKWGILGLDGSWIVRPRYTQKVSRLFKVRSRLFKGLVPAERDGKWGFVDATGEFVIPARYLSVRPFHRGVAYVEIDNRDCPIDRRGRRIERLECKVHQYRPKPKKHSYPVYPPLW